MTAKSRPAFPNEYGVGQKQQGMSLRDWFAGQALAGLLASGDGWVIAAGRAYESADAMLIQRENVSATANGNGKERLERQPDKTKP